MARHQVKPRRSRAAGPAVWVMLGAAVVAVLLYLPSRNMPFFFDDSVTVAHNRLLHSDFFDAMSDNPFRDVTNFTYYLQLKIHSPGTQSSVGLLTATPRISKGTTFDGKRQQAFYRDPKSGKSYPVTIDTLVGTVYPLPSTMPFRYFNLLLHLINAWLLYSILRKIGVPKIPAGASLVIFAIHPMATECVNYISARFDLMALLFSLAAVRVHLEADEWPRADYLALALFGLALFSKESAAALPAAVVILDLARGRFQRRVLWGFAPAVLYFIARLNWIIILDSGKLETLTWSQYLLVQQSAVWLYLGKIFIPIHQNYDYNYHPALLRDLAFGGLNLIIVAVAAVPLVRRLLARQKAPEPASWPGGPAALAWPVVLGLVLIAPTSSVIPLGDPVREMRAYPLLAVMAGLVPALIAHLVKDAKPWLPKAAVALAVMAILLFSLATFARNRVWHDDLTMSRDAMMKSPTKSRVIFNYASALLWWQHYEKSLYWTRRVLEVKPNHAQARYNVIILEEEVKKRKGIKTSLDQGMVP